MREQFEKLPEIARHIHKFVYQDDLNCYRNKIKYSDIHLITWVNGAWYTYQEQQRRIDSYNLKIFNFIKDLEKTHKDDKSNQFEYWRGFAGCANSVVTIFNRDVGYLDQDIERKP